MLNVPRFYSLSLVLFLLLIHVMGPKRNPNMEKERDQVSEIVNVETENADEELRRQVAELQQMLQLANEERSREKDRANARGRELNALSNTLRRKEHTAAIERDVHVRDYQGRINELMNNRVTSGIASSEGRSNDSASYALQCQDRHLRTKLYVVMVLIRMVKILVLTMLMPMPRQALFDGKTTWESFFQPFEALALACKWDNNEKLFRLTSCLRDEAAEYAFGQLPPEALRDFSLLEKSLESRYKEKRTSSSYLAELENRRMQAKEKLADMLQISNVW